MAFDRMNLRLFNDGGGAGAGAAPAGGPTGESGGNEAAVVTPGVLEDGTEVDARLAARMEKQAEKRKRRGEAPVMQAAPKAANEPQENAPAEEEVPDMDAEWAEAKKKFRDQYGRDVKAAVDDRFKNQKDANDQLSKVMPAIQALAKRLGLDENDTDGVIQTILDDDSLYEEDAEAAGMTVEGYKNFLAMEQENERLKAREAEEQEQMFLRNHFQHLAMQAEEMKKTFPGFDLRTELENETFRRLVAPNSGLDVRAAYYAVHHAELEPQAMAYGIQKAQQQMAQTLQANRARPVEGAMKKGQPANVSIDPRNMTREERKKLIERVRLKGERIEF